MMKLVSKLLFEDGLTTFSMNASVDGGSVSILGAAAAPFPNLVIQILYLMLDIDFSLTLLLQQLPTNFVDWSMTSQS